MDTFIESVFEFVGKLVAIVLVSNGVLLFAGEVRLAVLKKAQGGSSRLSGFTASMTKTRLPIAYGGRHGAGKKSH